MKKIIVAILAFLYLGVSSGIAMEIHYCMGKKSGIELYGSPSEKCGKCGMKGKTGCCNDEHKFYKINDSHKNIFNNLNFEHFVEKAAIAYPVYNYYSATTTIGNKIRNNSPPKNFGLSACILNCIFRL